MPSAATRPSRAPFFVPSSPFLLSPCPRPLSARPLTLPLIRVSRCARARVRMVAAADSLGLPPALRAYVDALASVPHPKLRYQQLLFLARQLPPMLPALKTDATRVRGCASVVHVHVSLDPDGKLRIQGDSDAQLTKGLLALLVNGLDGVDPHVVERVSPDFIEFSGLAVSLTPSRNNGFVNMLAKIKESVRKLQAAPPPSADGHGAGAGAGVEEGVPPASVYSSIVRKLQMLKPTHLEVLDVSAKHAGHAAAKGLHGESHFTVKVVADAFEPLNIVKRHRLIYTLLAEEMGEGGVHALSIDAKTPEEAAMS